MERLDNSKLSPLQRHIVDKMAMSKRLAVVGGPGTGKTVLAMSGMGLGTHKDQVLLTYSKPLSLMIYGCNVKSNTIHSFCWNFARDIEIELGDFSDEYEYEDNYNDALKQVINREYGYSSTESWPQWRKIISAYNRLSDEAKENMRYDAIFVDEGQDLPNEAFRFLSLIADRLIVTFDEAQEVGNEYVMESAKITRKSSVDCNQILSELSLQDSFYDLIDNFRNTAAIERVAKLFYNNYGSNNFSLRVVSANRPEGSKPKVIFTALNQQLFDGIADMAYQLNKQVGVIVPDWATFKTAKTFLDNAVARHIIPENRLFYKFGTECNMNKKPEKNEITSLNQPGVFLVTYQTSKGMEFDDVYLLDCQKNQLQSPADKNRLYVAATRAKETLRFVFNCSYYQSTPILDIIKENEECFDMEKR